MKDIQKSPFFNTGIFTLVWALQIFFSKAAYNNGAQAIPFTIQSAFVAIVFSSIILLPGLIGELKRISKRELAAVVAINIIHFGFGALLSNIGFAKTSAVNSGFLVQFATVWVIALSFFLLNEKIRLPGAITLVLLVLGSYLLSSNAEGIKFQVGDIWVIGATLCWALANVLSRKILVGSSISPNMIAFLRPISGLPIIVLAAIVAPQFSGTKDIFESSILDVRQISWVVVCGILTVLILVFLNRSLKYATANYTSMVSSSVSVIVAILAIVFLGEGMKTFQVIGAIFILIAGLVPNLREIDRS